MTTHAHTYTHIHAQKRTYVRRARDSAKRTRQHMKEIVNSSERIKREMEIKPRAAKNEGRQLKTVEQWHKALTTKYTYKYIPCTSETERTP